MNDKLLETLLDKVDGTKRMIDECVKLVEDKDSFVIFGAGVGGECLYKLLKANHLEKKIIGYSDNNSLKFNKSYMNENLIIIPPDELVDRFGIDIDIIIASSAYMQIKQQLIDLGYQGSNIHLYNFAFMNLSYTDCDFIHEHISDFQRAYDRMSDEKSRKIFVYLLNYKITKDMVYLEKMQEYVDDEKNQYFDKDIFEFIQEECFCDIGAYTGDTLASFIKHYEKWDTYYAFEADKYAYLKLKNRIQGIETHNKIFTYNLAAWNKEDKVYFTSNFGSSTMHSEAEKMENEVEAKKLDNILKNRKITMIKMDIEGAEYNALNGLKQVIKDNYPVLAISVYHLRDDYYKLTDFIDELFSGREKYKFYMRQYRYTPTETVCYAIPSNRQIKRI